MAGDVAAGLDQLKVRKKHGVAIDQAIGKRWMIPVGARFRKAGMTAAGQLIVGTLNDKFRLGEAIVIAGVIYIEVRTDDGVDVAWLQSDQSQLLDDVSFVGGGWSAGGMRIEGYSAVDEDVAVIASFNEVAAHRHLHRVAV